MLSILLSEQAIAASASYSDRLQHHYASSFGRPMETWKPRLSTTTTKKPSQTKYQTKKRIIITVPTAPKDQKVTNIYSPASLELMTKLQNQIQYIRKM